MDRCTCSRAHTCPHTLVWVIRTVMSQQAPLRVGSIYENRINLSDLFLVVTCSVQALIILTVKGQLFRLWADWMEHLYAAVFTLSTFVSQFLNSSPVTYLVKWNETTTEQFTFAIASNTPNTFASAVLLLYALKIIFLVYGVIFTAEIYNCGKKKVVAA